MLVGRYWLYTTGQETVYGSGDGGTQDQDNLDGIFDSVGQMENDTNYLIPASTFLLNQSFPNLGPNISLSFEQVLLEGATETPPAISTTETPTFLSKFLSIFQ